MWRRITSLPIRVKLILVLLAAVLMIVGTALYAAAEYRDAVQPVANSLAEALGQQRAQLLNAIGAIQRNTLRAIPLDDEFSAAFGALRASPEDATAREQVEDILRENLNAHPHIRNLRVLDLSGHILAAVPAALAPDDPDFANIDLWLGDDEGTDMYSGTLSTVPEPTMTFAITVRDESNQKAAYLVMRIDPSGSADPDSPSVYSALRMQILSSGTIAFYMMRSDGVIEAPFSQVIGSPADAQERARMMYDSRFTEARQYTSPLISRPVQGVIIPVPILHRVLAAESQLIDLGGRSETGRVLLTLAFLTLGSIIGLFLLGLLLDLIVVAPVKRLREMTERAVRGQRIQVSPTLPDDEIGSVMRSLESITALARQDITDLEARVAARTRDIEAARDLGQIISNIRDLDVLLKRVVSLILERFPNLYHVQIFLLDQTRQFAVLRVSTGEVGEKLLARGHRLAVGSLSVIGKTTAENQPVIARDTSRDPVHRANELLPETRAELALPLSTTEGVIGALDLQSKSVDAFTDSDIALFESVADQLTTSIVNAQLFQQSQERLKEIEALNRRLLGEAWRGYTNARRQSITGGKKAMPPTDVWSDIQRRAVQTRNIAEQFEGDQVNFAVPVMLRDQVFGAVEWTVSKNSYNENTRLLAWELAARLAVTADNARLLEQSQRFANRERMVSSITDKMVQQADVEGVLQTAIRELGLALGAPQASIRLVTTQNSSPESQGE
mgnify:CR=1 FL=1